MGTFVFKPEVEHFSGKNANWYRVLIQANEKGYESIDNDTTKLFEDVHIEVESSEDNLTRFLNALESFRQVNVNREKEQALKGLKKKITNLNEGNPSPEEIEESIREMQKDLSTYKFSDVKRSEGDITEAYKMYLEDEVLEVLPFNVKKIDESIGGGVSKGGITTIGGGPGVGKTTLAVQTATVQAVEGYNVLFLSLEQTRQDISSQVNSVLATMTEQVFEPGDRVGIANKSIIMNRNYFSIRKDMDEQERKMLANEAKALTDELIKGRGSLEIEDTKYTTLREVIDRITIGAEEGIDVVFIDNFQNAPRDNSFHNDRVAFDHLADQLERMAKELEIAVVALSQITKKRDGEYTTKYSDRLKQNTENFIVLRNPNGLVKENAQTISARELELIVEKTRFGSGKANKLRLPFNSNKGIIGNLSKPEWISKEPDGEKMKKEIDEKKLPF